MFNDFKIAAAILNHFHEPIVDNQYADVIVEQIRLKLDTPNILYNYVERKRFNQRRADFVRIEGNDVEFIRYTEEEVILLALGTYQNKACKILLQ